MIRQTFPFNMLGRDNAAIETYLRTTYHAAADSVTRLGPYTVLHYHADLFHVGRSGHIAFTTRNGTDSLVEWWDHKIDHSEDRVMLDSLVALFGEPTREPPVLESVTIYGWSAAGEVYRASNVMSLALFVKHYYRGSGIVDSLADLKAAQ